MCGGRAGWVHPARFGDPREPSGERHARPGLDLFDDVEVLYRARGAVLERHPERLELFVPPADARSKNDPAADE